MNSKYVRDGWQIAADGIQRLVSLSYKIKDFCRGQFRKFEASTDLKFTSLLMSSRIFGDHFRQGVHVYG